MSLADTITETDIEPKKSKKKPVVSVTLPLNFTTEHKLVKTQEGYQYDNVLISHDTPSHALAVMAENKIPLEQMPDFSVLRGMLAALDMKKAQATRRNNGIVMWPGGSFTIPSIGTEVYLRIIEDRIKTDPEVKERLPESARANMYKRLQTIIGALVE